MSRMSTLADMYDYLDDAHKKSEEAVPNWVPVFIGKNNVQIEVILSEDSKFLRAELLPKAHRPTLMPITEDSDARTSGIAPHPLFDKLQYVAGDLHNYTEKSSDGDQKKHAAYMKFLNAWSQSSADVSPQSIIKKYLDKNTLTKDLIRAGILEVNEDKKLTSKKYNRLTARELLVRFAIEQNGQLNRLWENYDFLRNYSNDYLQVIHPLVVEKYKQKDGSTSERERPHRYVGLCYVSGKNEQFLGTKHGKFLRSSGDQTKLISSNDHKNYTYRGRFVHPENVMSVSLLVSSKAYSALRWLIQHQAYLNKKESNRRNQEYTVLAYGRGKKPNTPYKSFWMKLEKDRISPDRINVQENYAKSLRKALRGYQFSDTLYRHENVCLLALDNATTGRLAIQYYREVSFQDYIDNLAYYYQSLAWKHPKWNDNDFLGYYYGVPTPDEIFCFTCGIERKNQMTIDNERYKKQLLRRWLPCIVERAPIPLDIIRNAIQTASNPMNKSKENWERSLSCACGLLRKHYFERNEEVYSMPLDPTIKDRSYLYGRLLAVADYIESKAIENMDDDAKRQSNAMRYMNTFSKRPCETWMNIELKFQPYLAKLNPGLQVITQKTINEIMSMFDITEFESKDPLRGTFLLGFHCQQNEFYRKREKKEKEEKEFENVEQ